MTKIVKEYCIVESINKSVLVDDVNDHLANGWQPFGHPFIVGSNYEQAMVKYIEEYPVPSNNVVDEVIGNEKRGGKK